MKAAECIFEPAMVVQGFEKMAQPDFLKETLDVLGGYTVAAGIDFAADRYAGRDVPDELSGVLAVAGIEMAPVVSGAQMRRMQLGGAAFAGMGLADRLGIADSIEGAL